MLRLSSSTSTFRTRVSSDRTKPKLLTPPTELISYKSLPDPDGVQVVSRAQCGGFWGGLIGVGMESSEQARVRESLAIEFASNRGVPTGNSHQSPPTPRVAPAPPAVKNNQQYQAPAPNTPPRKTLVETVINPDGSKAITTTVTTISPVDGRKRVEKTVEIVRSSS